MLTVTVFTAEESDLKRIIIPIPVFLLLHERSFDDSPSPVKLPKRHNRCERREKTSGIYLEGFLSDKEYLSSRFRD